MPRHWPEGRHNGLSQRLLELTLTPGFNYNITIGHYGSAVMGCFYQSYSIGLHGYNDMLMIACSVMAFILA